MRYAQRERENRWVVLRIAAAEAAAEHARTVQHAQRLQRGGGGQEGDEEAEVARADAVALRHAAHARTRGRVRHCGTQRGMRGAAQACGARTTNMQWWSHLDTHWLHVELLRAHSHVSTERRAKQKTRTTQRAHQCEARGGRYTSHVSHHLCADGSRPNSQARGRSTPPSMLPPPAPPPPAPKPPLNAPLPLLPPPLAKPFAPLPEAAPTVGVWSPPAAASAAAAASGPPCTRAPGGGGGSAPGAPALGSTPAHGVHSTRVSV
jgi:hypothetical protein